MSVVNDSLIFHSYYINKKHPESKKDKYCLENGPQYC